jgi:hypothetical protein
MQDTIAPEEKASYDGVDERAAPESGTWHKNEDDTRIRGLLDRALGDEEWLKIFRRLARSKNIRASELLLKYRFGLPLAKAQIPLQGLDIQYPSPDLDIQYPSPVAGEPPCGA